MAKVVVTFTIMPVSPETDLTALETLSKDLITKFAGDTEFRIEQKPVAFGLKSLVINFVMDEDIGSTESLEKDIAQLEGVNSVEVTDVRRAIG